MRKNGKSATRALFMQLYAELERNLFMVLGVHQASSQAEIRAAMLHEARLHHPDRGGSLERMVLINKAYDTLTDDYRGTMYRAALMSFPECEACGAAGFRKIRKGYETTKATCLACHGSGRVLSCLDTKER